MSIIPMPTAGGRCFALCLTNARRAVDRILCRYRARRDTHSRLRPPKPAHQPSGRRVHRQSQTTLKRLQRAHTSYRAMIASRQRLVASRIRRCGTARDKLRYLNARPWLAALSPHVYHRRRRNLSKRVHKYSLKASLETTLLRRCRTCPACHRLAGTPYRLVCKSGMHVGRCPLSRSVGHPSACARDVSLPSERPRNFADNFRDARHTRRHACDNRRVGGSSRTPRRHISS